MKGKYKLTASKRYYLHSKIRKQGFILDTYSRRINIPHNNLEIFKDVEKLRDVYGYSVQLNIEL